MTEIPSWWLIVSGLFFVLGIVAMTVSVFAMLKATQVLKEITPQIKATATRVEEVAGRVEEVAETLKKTVDELSGSARHIAGTAEGMVTKTASAVAGQSQIVVGIVTAIRIFKAIQEFRAKGRRESSNGAAHPASTKALPKPAKAKH